MKFDCHIEQKPLCLNSITDPSTISKDRLKTAGEMHFKITLYYAII